MPIPYSNLSQFLFLSLHLYYNKYYLFPYSFTTSFFYTIPYSHKSHHSIYLTFHKLGIFNFFLKYSLCASLWASTWNKHHLVKNVSMPYSFAVCTPAQLHCGRCCRTAYLHSPIFTSNGNLILKSPVSSCKRLPTRAYHL